MSGEYVKARIDHPVVTTVTVGYGGTGASAMPGATGGSSAFGDVVTAKGGLGGAVMTEGNNIAVVGPAGAYTLGFTGRIFLAVAVAIPCQVFAIQDCWQWEDLVAVLFWVRARVHRPLSEKELMLMDQVAVVAVPVFTAARHSNVLEVQGWQAL